MATVIWQQAEKARWRRYETEGDTVMEVSEILFHSIEEEGACIARLTDWGWGRTL